jgi:SAM-dependent methyltransferase
MRIKPDDKKYQESIMSQNTKRKKPRKNKKFRFQLLADWIIKNYPKCRVADVGGGKGLLAYLLHEKGWEVTVIDPVKTLPMEKFKDMALDKRIKLSLDDWNKIKWIEQKFEMDMIADFDLIVGLHAHGVNMKIIEGCAEFKKKFVLLPCCVIDEPIDKKPGVNWFDSLTDYATSLGLDVATDCLEFKGRNQVLFMVKIF